MDSGGGKYDFVNLMRSRCENTQEVNQALLDESKMQCDVETKISGVSIYQARAISR